MRRPAGGGRRSRSPAPSSMGSLQHSDADSTTVLPAYPAADSPDRRDQITALATNVCAAADAVVATDTVVVLDDVESADDDPAAVVPRNARPTACRPGCTSSSHAATSRTCASPGCGPPARSPASGPRTSPSPPPTSTSSTLDEAAQATVVDIINATGGWPLAVHLAIEIVAARWPARPRRADRAPARRPTPCCSTTSPRTSSPTSANQNASCSSWPPPSPSCRRGCSTRSAAATSPPTSPG